METLLNSILTCDTTVSPAVTKSLCFKTLVPVCLTTLFLSLDAVQMEEPLSTSSWRLGSLTKCDGTLCVDIRVIQELLWTEVKLVPRILCAQNPSFHCNSVHAMFIPIDHES